MPTTKKAGIDLKTGAKQHLYVAPWLAVRLSALRPKENAAHYCEYAREEGVVQIKESLNSTRMHRILTFQGVRKSTPDKAERVHVRFYYRLFTCSTRIGLSGSVVKGVTPTLAS